MMSLPSVLLSRLAKRGLLPKASDLEEKSKQIAGSNTLNNVEIEEEVIAENYDDQENQGNSINRIKNKNDCSDVIDDEVDENDLKKRKFLGHAGCPNKCNVFHQCTLFCKEYWGDGCKQPDKIYLKRKAAMLSKYPLPSHWKEIYDPGTGRHYYWETDSDSVSWLPPSHPRAIISESAANLRREQEEGRCKKNVEVDEKEVSKSDYSSEDESDDELKRRDEKRRRKEVEEKKRSRGRSKTRENDLDPMDPASYSDIPRGGWSVGLNKGNEAKTGADVTAAGPLYQMRPYPNPGAVLRANAKTSHKPAKSSDPENDDSL